jgi:quinate dehydrogenase (quinone)
MATEKLASWPTRVWAAFAGGLIGLVGLVLLGGGGWLIVLGGTPYYLLAGAGILATSVMLVRRDPFSGLVYGAVLAATLGWAIWEAGFSFWPLLPRLFAPAVLGLFLLLVIPSARRSVWRDRSGLATGVGALACLVVLGAAIPETFRTGQALTPAQVVSGAPAAQASSDWRYYGRDPGGARYTPVDQINRENVDELKVAWTFRTGEPNHRGSEDQNTPIQVGDRVYVCTPGNVVIALDADTGKEIWRHDPKVKKGFWNRCRGVGYWDGTQPRVAVSAAVPAAPVVTKAVVAKPAPRLTAPAVAQAAVTPAAPLCRRRILVSTINAQLIALDAATGAPCPDFGVDGKVDLSTGMGEVKKGFYFQTSTPTVIGNRVVVGGWVMDNREIAEPAGVVRAFDVVSGELVWAWDLGNPAITKLPPEGQTYTRGTPNVWSTPAFDPDLGLIYLPTGNSTPDYWGSHRSLMSEFYSSSVVALDAATGKERWVFQTVHHDVWDYDVPSQPMLIDFPVAGGTAPALVQFTKRGQIFVLDRRTGKPLTKVVEVHVPRGAQPGEWLRATQPYSVEMPTIGVERLTEAMMWGATPLDQMACRITFKQLRYDGDFTPPGGPKQASLQYPGNAGGMNWGSGAYDVRRGLLLVTDVRIPQSVRLVATKDAGLQLKLAKDRPPPSMKAVAYKSQNDWLVSPIFTPCLQPPHGTLSAVDVKTRKLVWQVPVGTAEDEGPLGMGSRLPIPIGSIGLGGPMTTAGGVTFHAATMDPYLRAYDNATGKVLWQGRLPVGAGGTPMSYVSPKTGKQYVVVSAGGARLRPARGDYVIAYALP